DHGEGRGGGRRDRRAELRSSLADRGPARLSGQSDSASAARSVGKANGFIVVASSGQAHSGQGGGSAYTSTGRSQYGHPPIRIAGGSVVSFAIGTRPHRGERSPNASAGVPPALTRLPP